MYYDTTLQKAFARGVKAHLNDLPNTWKLTFMLGRYLQSEYNGVFYSKSQNLVRELCKAYDKILEDFDVLLMPTAPKKARTFPSPDSALDEVWAFYFGSQRRLFCGRLGPILTCRYFSVFLFLRCKSTPVLTKSYQTECLVPAL